MGKRAGLSYRLTPHDLRHGAATCSLEAGEPIHRVQQLLRHASPVTTQRYDHSRNRLDASAAYGLARAVSGAA
jgi:integrase